MAKSTKEHKEFMKQFRFMPCFVCGSTYQSTGHHLVPQKRNGEDTLENVKPLCFNCHNIVDNGTKSQFLRECGNEDLYYYLRKDLNR